MAEKVPREGIEADDERAQAIRDFPPLKTKQQLQQFAGCTNWLRQHMPEQYSQALKVLAEFLKPGAVFPEKGIGPGETPADYAFEAVKVMSNHLIKLSIMDEAAAIDGSRPLEQVADCSGLAWRGSCLQMKTDPTGFNV